MTRPNDHEHGDIHHGYASCRGQCPTSSRSRRVRPRPRQLSGRGGVPGPAARYRAPQRRLGVREPRTQRTSPSQRRGQLSPGARDYATVVLDAWPVLRAYGGQEPARSALRGLLHDDSRTAVMSTVNLSEAIGALLQQFGPEAADSQERILLACGGWLRSLGSVRRCRRTPSHASRARAARRSRLVRARRVRAGRPDRW